MSNINQHKKKYLTLGKSNNIYDDYYYNFQYKSLCLVTLMLQMTQLLVQYGLQSSKPVILYSMFTAKLSLLHLQYFFSMHIKLADQKFL